MTLTPSVIQLQPISSLHTLRQELDQSLLRARQCVETYVEAPEDRAPLQQAALELHQIQGSASIIQCFGVAALAEDMKQAVLALLQQRVSERDAMHEALTGALIQLADYVDALSIGFDDCALVLLPLMNELRLAGGRPVLTEEELFAAQMQTLHPAPVVTMDLGSSSQAQQLTRRLVPGYETALLQWFKGVAPAQNQARIGKIAEQIADAAQHPTVQRLCRALAACIEALLTRSLAETLALKRLMGRLGMQLKLLADLGEQSLDTQTDLLPSLLFFIGRSQGRGQRVAAVRQQYRLDVYLPSVEALDQLRRRLRGPNTHLLNRVSSEVRADLSLVKDAVDLAVRTNAAGVQDSGATRERLQRIGKTLAMLGLNPLQRIITQQVEAMEGMERASDVRSWMDFATALLHVEENLDDALFRQLRRLPPEPETDFSARSEYSAGSNALMRESLINLAKIKAFVDSHLRQGDSALFTEGPRLLQEIVAGFSMLGHARPAQLVSSLAEHLRGPGVGSLRSDAEHANRLADAVAGLEYYMEALRAGLGEADRRLDEAEAHAARLRSFGVPFAEPEAEAEVPTRPVPAAEPEPEDIDPEIREVFLEEASEVLAALRGALPRWLRDSENLEVATDIRRAFHTLKGSGRMVGAATISHFALAVERLLNRCLDGTVSVDGRVIDLVRAAVDMLPALIEAFRTGAASPDAAVEQIGAEAEALAARNDEHEGLRQVFRQDAAERLQVLREWLSEQDPERGQYAIAPEVLRAFHTLRGGGYAVNAEYFGELAGALETYLESLVTAGFKLDGAGLSLIGDSVEALASWASRAGAAIEPQPDIAPWLARIEALQAAVPKTAVDAASDRQLAEVFAAEAFDLVEVFERGVQAWSRSPDARYHAPDLKSALHTLHGAALMSACPPIAAIAFALHERMDEFAEGQPPAPGFFRKLLDVAEQLFRHLDAYREGERRGDPSEGLRLVQEIDVADPGPPQVVPERAASHAADALAPDAPAEASAAAAPGFEGEPADPLPAEAAPEAPAAWPASGPDTTPALADPLAEVDVELQEIFLSEAGELLEAITSDLQALEQAPYDPLPVSGLRRSFHTLKGSSRIAGFPQIGEIAYRLERLYDAVKRNQTVVDATVLATTRAVHDGLRLMVDDFSAGRPLDTVTALSMELSLRQLDGPTPQSPEGAEAEPTAAAQGGLLVGAPDEASTVFEDIAQAVEQQETTATADDVPVPGPDSAAWAPPSEGEVLELRIEDFPAAVESGFETYAAAPVEVALEGFAPEWDAAAGDGPAELLRSLEPAPFEVTADFPDPALGPAAEPETALLSFEMDLGRAAGAPTPEAPDILLIQEPEPLFDAAPAAAFASPPQAGMEEGADYAADRGWNASWTPETGTVEERVLSLEPAEALGLGEPAPASEAPGDGNAAAVAADADAASPGPAFGQPFEMSPEPAPQSWQPPTGIPPPSEPFPYLSPAPSGHDDGALIDPELVDIFNSEAAELIEVLESSLREWREDASSEGALREVQRALHTLKGGARMAGLGAMASAAHDMETQVNALELGRLPRSRESFALLAAELEALQHMHDQLARGDYHDLGSAPAEAAPTAYAPETRPQEPLVPMPGFGAQGSGAFGGQEPEMPPDFQAEPVLGSFAPFDEGADLPPAIGEIEPAAAVDWEPQLFWKPEEPSFATGASRRETARVSVDRLDAMLNEAGEISIYRSRLEEQNVALQQALTEMSGTVTRLREQLRLMEIETEAQIAARGFVAGAEKDLYESEFDPLEMDRYSRMQELSRTLIESVGDLSSLHLSMEQLTSSSEALLQQQGRINTDVQTGLMGTLMVPFSRQVQRLQRVVRQTADDNRKLVDLSFVGEEAELDRNVLERMTAPLEHLLRNCVVHGVEPPEQRRALGKQEIGLISVSLHREGTQLLVEVSDDGRGLDHDAIRLAAIARGLLSPGAMIGEDEIARFIFTPGFSTASRLTQDAGRGIGMDVVASEVKLLGGTVELASERGRGTRFLIRLPLMLAISQALLVGVGAEQYAIPISGIDGISRVPRDDMAAVLESGRLLYGEREYQPRYLGEFLEAQHGLDAELRHVPVILVRSGEGLAGSGEQRVGLIVDQLLGNREIVSKAMGSQVGSVPGITGATVLADGRVVLILDVQSLLRLRTRSDHEAEALNARALAVSEPMDQPNNLVMVVDDSITMRRVAERLLTRNGYRVVTARDGLEAMGLLQTESPLAMLLDIEMPRADGFEVAAFVRNTGRIARLPIIMITSRSGEKHRDRARRLGVNRYLIKPYQEDQLLEELRSLIRETAVEALEAT